MPTPTLDLDAVVELCRELSRRIHQRTAGQCAVEYTPFNVVAFKLFGYSLNTFKSIFYLLPHTVYEQATVLYRTLWETAATLEWISQDPSSRSDAFLSFTAVEHCRFREARIRAARRAGNSNLVLQLAQQLAAFERALDQQLSSFGFTDRRGRRRWRERFAGINLREIATALGGEWLEEYDREYLLACSYTHGAPGAVLFPLFETQDHALDQVRSGDRSAVLGVASIAVMSRIYRRLLAIRAESDDDFLRDLAHRATYVGARRDRLVVPE